MAERPSNTALSPSRAPGHDAGFSPSGQRAVLDWLDPAAVCACGSLPLTAKARRGAGRDRLDLSGGHRAGRSRAVPERRDLDRGASLDRGAELITLTVLATSRVFTASGTAAAAIDVVAGALRAADSCDGLTPAVVRVSPTDVAMVCRARATPGGGYLVYPVAAARRVYTRSDASRADPDPWFRRPGPFARDIRASLALRCGGGNN
ncbi:hypothetical protein GCM10009562_37760 [Nocardioides aquaticus]